MTRNKQQREINPAEHEKLRERVAKRLDGLSILVVGNREDAELARLLAQEFTVGRHAPARIEVRQVANFSGAMPRALSAIGKRITSNTYDVVMAIESFLPHTVTKQLRAATKSAGVDMIMIGKGRPNAAVRAVAKFYNLDGPRTNPDPKVLVKRLMS
jgi:CHASE3 domain sensor protein